MILNILWASEAYNKLLSAIDIRNAKQSVQIKELASLAGWDPIWAAVVEEGSCLVVQYQEYYSNWLFCWVQCRC